MEFEQLLTLIQKISDSGLTEFRLEEHGIHIHMKKKAGQAFSAEKAPAERADAFILPSYETENASEVVHREGHLVTSPLVGTFYAAPQEGTEPFVSVGDSVTRGQVVAIVEAMKLMNEIESEFDGTVAEVFVTNGQAVEYGQPLFRIR